MSSLEMFEAAAARSQSAGADFVALSMAAIAARGRWLLDRAAAPGLEGRA